MNIALFLPNWVGDVVMATPAIRAIRERYPDARLIGICKPYVASVVEGAPWFDEIFLYDRNGPTEQRSLSLIGRLRRSKIDAAVLFPNSFRAGLIAWLGNCKCRVGFGRYGRSILLTDRLKPKTDEKGHVTPNPVIDEFNRLAMAMDTSDPGHRMELFTTGDDEAAADRVWREQPLDFADEVVGLNSGGAFGAAKDWTPGAFAELAQNLVDHRGSRVLVLCGPKERETAQRIVALARRPGVCSLADYTPSLGLTKACVRRLDLLVTTDSGPRHFAAAFDRPVVTLFGPTHIAWTETYFEKAVHLQKKVSCGPCQKRECPQGHHSCMRDMTPREVFDASNRLLQHFAPMTTRGLRDAG